MEISNLVYYNELNIKSLVSTNSFLKKTFIVLVSMVFMVDEESC